MKRLVLLAALAAVLFGTSCSSVERSAATIGDTTVSADDLQREVEVILDNPGYREALEQSYGSAVRGEAKGTFTTAFVAQVLKFRVFYELLEQALEGRGYRVNEKDREQGAKDTEDQFAGLPEGAKILKSFPRWYRRQLDRQAALFYAASRYIEARYDDPREYYDEHEDEFETACASHILVSTEDRSATEARARADELLQRLETGEDFAAVAREASDDGTKDNGGDLGCTGRGQYVDEFDEAVFEDAPIGQVFGPVETQFGQHLVLVRSRELPAYDDIRAQVETAMNRARNTALDEFAADATCTDDVEVRIDPKYGSWDRASCADASGFPEIALPPQPTTTVSTVPPQVEE